MKELSVGKNIRKLLSCDSGAVAPLVAVCAVMLIGAVAVAVDVGRGQVAQSKLRHAVSLNSEPLELKRAYYAAQVNDPAAPEFNLQWVGDTSRAATILAPVLAHNTTVTTLNLSNSRIGDAGRRLHLGVGKRGGEGPSGGPGHIDQRVGVVAVRRLRH